MVVMTLKTTYYFEMGTPIGPLLLVGSQARLQAIHFQSGPHPTTVRAEWTASERPFRSLVRQLKEYFAGRRRQFDVPLEPIGTPFQRAVWQELTQIPYGASTSYGEIARRLGHPLASRAGPTECVPPKQSRLAESQRFLRASHYLPRLLVR